MYVCTYIGRYACMHACMYNNQIKQSTEAEDGSTGPARGQLKRENECFSVPVCGLEFGVARKVRPSRPAPACSFCTRRLNLLIVLLTGFLPISATASIYLFILYRQPPSGQSRVLSGHATACRWRSLPRVRQHRASSPQGSSRNGCCLCRSPWTN